MQRREFFGHTAAGAAVAPALLLSSVRPAEAFFGGGVNTGAIVAALKIIEGFLDLFLQGAADAIRHLQPYAQRLVAILATISVVLTFTLGALRKDFDPVGTLVGKILLIGLVVWFIGSWPDLLDQLIEGAVFLGSAAGGRGDPAVVMQPLSVITWGWDFAGLCFLRIRDLSGPIATFENFDVIVILTVCALVVAFAYLIMGVTIAVALVAPFHHRHTRQ